MHSFHSVQTLRKDFAYQNFRHSNRQNNRYRNSHCRHFHPLRSVQILQKEFANQNFRRSNHPNIHIQYILRREKDQCHQNFHRWLQIDKEIESVYLLSMRTLARARAYIAMGIVQWDALCDALASTWSRLI